MEVQDQDQVASEISRERTLLGLITDIQNGLARRFRERTQHLGISRAQWRVLTMLIGRPGATQTELAELVFAKPSNESSNSGVRTFNFFNNWDA